VSEWQLTWIIIALLLGSTAILVYFVAHVSERRNPPIGRFLDVDGVRLHYLERGQGPPLVLLHGNGTMIQDFVVSGLLDAAAADHRVIAFDRPGFGYSSRPRNRIWTPHAQARLIHDALRQLGVNRAVVLGHSWGTLVAIALAVNHPHTVRSLVLLSGFYFPRFRFDALLFSPPAIPVIGDVLRYTVSPVLGALLMPLQLRAMFGPPPVPARFKERFPISLLLRPWQIRASAAEAGLMIPSAAMLRPRYPELAQAVMIMAGTDDRIATIDRQSGRLHAALPGSEFRAVPGVGHMIHHTVPDQVLSALRWAAMPQPADEVAPTGRNQALAWMTHNPNPGTLNPGDEAEPGTPGTGEDVCPGCKGSGQIAGRSCEICGGTGKIIEGVGGA
jgi:pimeloyl-ACP methyl ester carboxylesterase